MADREERIRIFEETLALCREDGELREGAAQAAARQRIVWEEEDAPVPAEAYGRAARVLLSPKRTLAAAGPYARAGKRVCVLNFASSVTPGGGVTRGAGAQEESLCRVSTLYAALTAGTAAAFYRRHRELIQAREMGRENRDDCIFTPGVTVIREDDFDCALLPREARYRVDVITCAAPDLRWDRDGNTWTPGPEELTALLTRRWRRILAVAAGERAEVLILGAFGCGAFRNPPELAAEAFNRAFPDFAKCFETVEFAVFTDVPDAPNYRAFRAVENPGVQPEEPGIRQEEADVRPTPGEAKADAWLRLLRLTDQLNRRVKEPGWQAADRQTVYALKDRMLRALLERRPPCVAVSLRYVPYLAYSMASRDRAGQLMRRDGSRYSFEYYLSQIPPTADDREVPEKAMVELEAACGGETFSFHMPAALAEACGVDCAALPRRSWTAAPEFFHQLLTETQPVMEELLGEVEG